MEYTLSTASLQDNEVEQIIIEPPSDVKADQLSASRATKSAPKNLARECLSGYFCFQKLYHGQVILSNSNKKVTLMPVQPVQKNRHNFPDIL